MVAERGPSEEPSQPAAEDHSHDIYTVANIVTVLRLILVPFFFTVLINGNNDVVAFLIFTVAASTDWVDGQIARRTGTVTVIGKAIDPLVDRLLLASGVLGLYLEARLPAWIVVVLLLRDAYLLWGAWRLEHGYKRRMPVTFSGKLTTAILLTGFAALILNWPLVPGLGIIDSEYLPGWGSEPFALAIWLVYAGVVLSVITAISYAAKGHQMAADVRADRQRDKVRVIA